MKTFGKLECIVFIGGMMVMILELIGSRILAPFLGNSIYVWTSIIGIILGSLSIGYHIGGKLSAAKPKIEVIGVILFTAGLLILFTAFIKSWVLQTAMGFGVKTGSVFATVFLFSPASVVLGMLSPYVIRLKITDVEHSGNVAGTLYAISTVGSIIGTFLAGFVLIPRFGGTQLLYSIAAVLILTSLIAYYKKPVAKMAIVLLIFGAMTIEAKGSGLYVYEADSAYNHIRVADVIETATGRPLRVLFLATETHSIMYQDDPTDVFSEYHKAYQLDYAFKPKISSALMLGGGAYIAAKDFLLRFPESEMTVVEIDPEVTQTARTYFDLPDDPDLKIVHEDARHFLAQDTNKYDVIYGDAFSSYFSIPFHLTTVEAMQLISDHLVDDGILVLNLVSSLEGEHSLFFQSEYKTISEVFPQVYVFPAHYQTPDLVNETQNIVLIASKNPTRLTKEELYNRVEDQQLKPASWLLEKEIIFDPRSLILTDELAPVDYFISKFL